MVTSTRPTVVPGLRAARTACSTVSRVAKPRSTITSLRKLLRPPAAPGGVTPAGTVAAAADLSVSVPLTPWISDVGPRRLSPGGAETTSEGDILDSRP